MKKTSKNLPIISFIISLLCGHIISLVLGIISLKKNKENKSFSIAAIAISIIEIIVIIYIFANWSSINKPKVQDEHCVSAYECKKLDKDSASCKYKDEDNAEHAIKCYIDDYISAQIVEEKNDTNFQSINKKEFKDNNNIISKTFILADNELYAKMPSDESVKNQLESPTIAKFNNEEYVLITPNVSEFFIVQDGDLEYMFFKSFNGKMFYINNYKNSTSAPFTTVLVRELKEIIKMGTENNKGYGEDSHGLKTYINEFIIRYSRFK